MAAEFCTLDVAGAPLQIELAWVGVQDDPAAPLMVFLHEGLGSLAAWRDTPHQLCTACGWRGLVYSRPGYGGSTPRPHAQDWPLDYLQRQAWEVLPALLHALGVQGRYGLFGHSDGGTIALLHAARHPETHSLIVLAPHIMVEEFGLASIREARRQYLEGDLRSRLARYHADVDSAFWGWNNAWLHPDFGSALSLGQISLELKHIRAPILAIQGLEDPYGTMAQIDGIAAILPATELLKLKRCGHAPHRDQPQHLLEACQSFSARHLFSLLPPQRDLP
ncbi:MAG: alpha/beta hydrolase [Ideonella sp. MAG2]|nr:MAG: alpha/beta hydrolase [Ideonella sp. MAG2]